MFELNQFFALNNLVDYAINSWIGPAFVGILAVVALILLWKRQFAAFFGFAGMAILAGLFIFFGSSFFGKDGNITKGAKNAADKVNTVNLADTTYSPDFLKLK